MSESYELRPGTLRRQRELVCGECPLDECSEESLWCLYRFLTKPNALQRAILQTKASIRQRDYQQRYYQRHREKKLADRKERYYAAKREAVRG